MFWGGGEAAGMGEAEARVRDGYFRVVRPHTTERITISEPRWRAVKIVK